MADDVPRLAPGRRISRTQGFGLMLLGAGMLMANALVALFVRPWGSVLVIVLAVAAVGVGHLAVRGTWTHDG